MWLGTNVTLLPLHNPIELAEVGAFMDVMSDGKFLLGVGLGYRAEEYEMYRVPMQERVSRFVEGIEIVKRLWSEDNVTHRGRHWQFTDATIRPSPLQRPRPPIIVGAQVPAAIKRAAAIGDGWLLVPTPTLDQVAKQMATYRAACAGAGAPSTPHICRLLEVGCAQDEETVIRRVAPHLIEKYKAYFSWGLEGLKLDPEAGPEQQFRDLAAHRFAVGTPAQVTEMLMAQHRVGITHLAMRVSWPGMAQGISSPASTCWAAKCCRRCGGIPRLRPDARAEGAPGRRSRARRSRHTGTGLPNRLHPPSDRRRYPEDSAKPMQLQAKQSIGIVVNGEAAETAAANLAELIAELGHRETEVATALNGDFVPRSVRAQARLVPGDKVEIVAPRQGG
jgi:thiamine biosynthesis protein ThiS